MAKSKLTAAAIVALLVMALASPAGADALDSDLQKKADAHSKKVQAASKLDAAKAEDGQLETAVRDLDATVDAQKSTTQSADQAASAAQTAVGTAEARLAATESKMSELKAKAAAVAI